MGLAGMAAVGAKKAHERMEHNQNNINNLNQALVDPYTPTADKEIIAAQLNSIDKRRTRRLIGGLAGVAILGASVGTGIYEGIRSVAPRVVTTVTVGEADAVWGKVSLQDQPSFEVADGHTSVQLESSTAACAPSGILARVLLPFLAGKCTPGILHEHAGGIESGSVEAVIENSDAVTLSALKFGNKLHVLAQVDEADLGVQTVNTFWQDSGPQDGELVKIGGALGFNSHLAQRENAAELIARNNFLNSGAAILGNPSTAAAGIATVIRDTTLKPSEELLAKVGPQGADLLKKMDANTMYIEYVYPSLNSHHLGELITVDSPNVLQAPSPIESSKRTVSVTTAIGQVARIHLSVTTENPNQTLETIGAASDVGKIMETVQREGNMYAVDPPQLNHLAKES